MQGLDPELAKDLSNLAGGFTLYYESEGVEMSDAGNKAGDPYGHLAASVLIEGIAEWRSIRITRAITKRKTIPDRAFCLVEWFHSVDAESLMDLAGVDPIYLRESLSIPTAKELRGWRYSWKLTQYEEKLMAEKKIADKKVAKKAALSAAKKRKG